MALIHEHQNPTAGIKWNINAVYKFFEAPPNLWSREHIDRKILKKYDKADLPNYRTFDPESIMAVELPAQFTGGVRLGGAMDLSASDKRFIAAMYSQQ